MKFGIVFGLSAAMLACFLGNARADELETLGPIEIPSLSVASVASAGNFMVIDSRMTETGTAAVFAGVIGAAINSAVNTDEDEDKADRYRATADRLQLGTILETSIIETLEKRGFPLSSQGGHQLSVELKDWGLSRISFHQPQATVFMKVHVVMRDGRKVIWDTHMKDSGPEAALLADISNESFEEQMTALAAKTGKRIAYEIIYR